jgi:hypothetical protein
MIWPKVSFWPSQYLDEPLATPRRESDLTGSLRVGVETVFQSVGHAFNLDRTMGGCYLGRTYEVRYPPIVVGALSSPGYSRCSLLLLETAAGDFDRRVHSAPRLPTPTDESYLDALCSTAQEVNGRNDI